MKVALLLLQRSTESFKQKIQGKSIFRMLTLVVAMIIGLNLQAQDPPQYGTPFSGVPDPRDINMYQVHIRPFSANGDLDGVTARLDNIQSMGINVIYLMPIYPHGTEAPSSASPYCIKDFKTVGSEYGNLTDLRELVDGAHARGMAVILDWVANQTAWDHPWITEHPEYYVQDGNGQPNALYPDVAELNTELPAVRAEMIEAMRYWIFAANIDGYRCDYANKASVGFWTEVIGNLRGISSHDLLFLAEGDRQENFNAGFDMNFGDRWFWNSLKNIAEGGPVSARTQEINDYEYALASGSQQAVRYTGNHDTYTNDGGSHRPFLVFNNHDGVVANFLISAFMKGVPFLMSGQEIDYEPLTPWPWNSFKFNWSQNPGAAQDFSKILNFRKNSTAIRRGSLNIYPSDNVSVFTKTSGSEQVLVIANLRNYSTTYNVPSAISGTWNDAFTGSSVSLSAGNLSLAPYEYLALTNSGVTPVDVTGVTVSPTSTTISEGLTQQLNATISPSNASNQAVSWSSNNTSVATVDSNGLVTGVSQGTATITVTTNDGGFTANATITVEEAESFTVHFYRPSSWGTGINIYYWNTMPSGVIPTVNWPGVQMINEGNNWYAYTFTNITSTNLIFNDGSNQTADLVRSTDGWYQNGTWYNSNPGGCNPTPITPYTNVNGGGWNPTTTATLDAGGTVAFGPQPSSGGSWSWSGPNGYSASVREITLSNVQVSQSGTYVVTHTNSCGELSTQNFSLTVNSTGQSPYSGVIAIPGTVQAENFDSGGEGVAYHDIDGSNNGGQYRTSESVDIEACSEGGFNIGWTDTGEWMEYTVDVASSGNYDIAVRVAGAIGGSFRIEFDGVDKTGSISVPNTGGWQNWQTVNVNSVALDAGQQIMRIYLVSGGYNLNYVELTASQTGGGGSTYYIKNRWQGTYLYDAGTNVSYSGFSSADDHKWELVSVDGHTALQNVATGDYMNIESLNGTIQSTNISTGAWSAQWAVEDYDGHKRFNNRWQSGDYIHLENQTGNAQHGTINAAWHSSHWVLESVSGSRMDGSNAILAVNDASIYIYPNPFSHKISLSINGLQAGESFELAIWDLSGKKVLTGELRANGQGILSDVINTENLESGLYFLKIESQRGSLNRKLIKN